MSPSEQGRFCESCEKCVLDLSEMENHEITDLLACSEKSICARVKKSQLNQHSNSLTSNVFSPIVKAAGVAGVIASLLSCNSEEDQELLVGGLNLDEKEVKQGSSCTLIRGQIKNQDGFPVSECALIYRTAADQEIINCCNKEGVFSFEISPEDTPNGTIDLHLMNSGGVSQSIRGLRIHKQIISLELTIEEDIYLMGMMRHPSWWRECFAPIAPPPPPPSFEQNIQEELGTEDNTRDSHSVPKPMDRLVPIAGVANEMEIPLELNSDITLDTHIESELSNTSQESTSHRIDPLEKSNLEEYKVNVYPNPAFESINIESEEVVILIELFDLKGAFIASQREDSKLCSMNTMSLPPGTYALRISTDLGMVTKQISIASR